MDNTTNDIGNFFEGKSIPEGFRLELHLHTSEASKCASMDGKTAADMYKLLGYDGIVVTNHFINGNTSVDRSLPWPEQMELFFKGYDNAYAEGIKIGLKVFCSLEFNYKSTEFIILGLDKKWYIDHPEIMNMAPEEFIPFFKDNGAYIIQVHPYRYAWYIEVPRPYAYLVDAIEVINIGNQKLESDIWARRLAKLYNKTMVAGSDCHHYGKGYGAGVVLNEIPCDEKDIIRILRKNEHSIFGREAAEIEAEP